MRRKLFVLLALVITVVGSVVAAIVVRARGTSKAASLLLPQLSKLHAGESKKADIDAVMSSLPERFKSLNCEATRCNVMATFSNDELVRARLATNPTRLKVIFEISNGVLQKTYVFYEVQSQGVIWIADNPCVSCSQGSDAFHRAHVPGGGEVIDLTPESTPEQRQQAFRLNTKPLSQLGSVSIKELTEI